MSDAPLFSKLRPDVRDALEQIIANVRRPASFFDYESAKRRISRICGHDASPEMCDQKQFDLAMAEIVRGLGL